MSLQVSKLISIRQAGDRLPDILAGKEPVAESLLRELAYWATAPSPKKHKEYDLTALDTSEVTDMQGLFEYSESFNQPIGGSGLEGGWDVSNVTDMSEMFSETELFNQPLDDWDVSKVRDMACMFDTAKAFNQPIGSWNVSSVKDIRFMFYKSQSFVQDISWWHLSEDREVDCTYHDCPTPKEFQAAVGLYERKMTERAQADMTDIINADSLADDGHSPQL